MRQKESTLAVSMAEHTCTISLRQSPACTIAHDMTTDNEIQIEIDARTYSSIELQQRLEMELDVIASGVALRVVGEPLVVRAPESTILIAVVSAVGGAVAALLGGLLQIAREAKAAKLVLQDQAGRRIEVPAETPPERISALVTVLKEMEQPKITLH